VKVTVDVDRRHRAKPLPNVERRRRVLGGTRPMD